MILTEKQIYKLYDITKNINAEKIDVDTYINNKIVVYIRFEDGSYVKYKIDKDGYLNTYYKYLI